MSCACDGCPLEKSSESGVARIECGITHSVLFAGPRITNFLIADFHMTRTLRSMNCESMNRKSCEGVLVIRDGTVWSERKIAE
jgi:hypothetical protein